jgi:hypothetical protein
MRRAFDSSQRARLHRALDRAIDRHRDRRAADSLRELAIARGQTEEAFGRDAKPSIAEQVRKYIAAGESGNLRESDIPDAGTDAFIDEWLKQSEDMNRKKKSSGKR